MRILRERSKAVESLSACHPRAAVALLIAHGIGIVPENDDGAIFGDGAEGIIFPEDLGDGGGEDEQRQAAQGQQKPTLEAEAAGIAALGGEEEIHGGPEEDAELALVEEVDDDGDGGGGGAAAPMRPGERKPKARMRGGSQPFGHIPGVGSLMMEFDGEMTNGHQESMKID